MRINDGARILSLRPYRKRITLVVSPAHPTKGSHPLCYPPERRCSRWTKRNSPRTLTSFRAGSLRSISVLAQTVRPQERDTKVASRQTCTNLMSARRTAMPAPPVHRRSVGGHMLETECYICAARWISWSRLEMLAPKGLLGTAAYREINCVGCMRM